ncbi:MAG: L-threonylcarbamoyladenylate synthase [Acidobacteriota bacterium]|nr:L-threonylcarbamoyladenylate synthase [Acidobacteriota bacterium]
MNSRISLAAELLRAGRLVAFPTETVYGLGANALDATAVARIFEAKGRPRSSPLIVHVENAAMARELALNWSETAAKLAAKFWPGPLTIIVPKRGIVPDIVTAGLPSVGLRMPAHPLALELLKAAGLPLAAPSANRFTELSPTIAAHVPNDLCDMILDGGACTVGIESTVLSLAGPLPRILRAGMITQPEIEAVIGGVESGAGAESPGQHPKHYSPRTKLVLGPSPTEGRGIRPEMPRDPAAYAESLYRVLHEIDRQGYEWIALDPPPDTPEWAGILDRLKRAAADC